MSLIFEAWENKSPFCDGRFDLVTNVRSRTLLTGLVQVQGSSEGAKTSFLEKKGLTGEEIKEAFSRAAKSNNGESLFLAYVSQGLEHCFAL